MNLNKLTRAELISKLEKTNKNEKSKTTSATFLDLIFKFKIWILSLTIITILSQIFKKYKSIRAILKIANYMILTMFGMSLYEAFGFGLIANFLGELKNILWSGVKYLTETTFYRYLISTFNAVKDTSVRSTYKKPVEIDWKEEYQKAERQREIEKWKEKYERNRQDNEKTDVTKTVLLLLLFLGGSAATWYYGKDALDVISPLWNMKDIIKRVLRGGRGNDDDDNNYPDTTEFNKNIELHPDVRAISPDMLVYSSDQVEKEILNTLPSTHPANLPGPSSSTVPPIPHTEEGPPSTSRPSFLGDILKKSKLKPTKTKISKSIEGKILSQEEIDAAKQEGRILPSLEIENGKSEIKNIHPLDLRHAKIEGADRSSKTSFDAEHDTSLTGLLSSKLNKMKSVMTGDLDDSLANDTWEESEQTTPTNLKGKGKAIDLESPRSDKAELGIVDENIGKNILKKGKNKFLDAIKKDENINPLPTSKISAALKPVMENFPNLKPETLEKLSVLEGIKNRDEILETLSDEELSQEITYSQIEYTHKVKNIIEETKHLDSEAVINKIQEEFPNFKPNDASYTAAFMRAVDEEINSGRSDEEKEAIRQQFLKTDLLELQKTGGSSNLKELKNVIRENYTHNSILKSIKSRHESSPIESPPIESPPSESSPTAQFDSTMDLFD